MESTDSQSIKQLQKEFKMKWDISLERFENQFNRTDCYFKTKTGIREVEVKRRRFNSSRFEETIINLDKFKEILKRKAYLVIMFDDCGFLFKSYKDAFAGCEDFYCRSTTDFEGYYRGSTKVKLKLSKAKKYYYEQ